MSGQSVAPLLEAAAPPALAPAPAPKTSRGMAALLAVAVVVLVANLLVMGVLLKEVTSAKSTMEDANVVFAQAKDLMDFPNRVLHGSLPSVVNNLLQTDYQALSRNVTKLSMAVFQLFDSFASRDSGMWQVAKYSSLVTSVAKRTINIQPRWASIVPKPSDDQGVVNMFSYLSEFMISQMYPANLRSLGQSCTAFLDAVLNMNWADDYSWNLGRNTAHWDVNSWKSTMSTIYEYCDRAARLPPDMTVDDMLTNVNVGEPLPAPAPTPTPAPAPSSPRTHDNKAARPAAAGAPFTLKGARMHRA